MQFQRPLCALVWCMLATASAAAVDFTTDGPCTYQKVIAGPQTMTPETGCKLQACMLKTTSTSYKAYANRLASYGYAVVQYDAAAGTIITDNVELKFMQQVLDNLKKQANDMASMLNGRINFDVLAVAGHSRGGKLAALQLATNSAVKTGYLIDPVDNTMFSPESPQYPSAVKALQQAQPVRVAGVSGAGIASLCNPTSANYQRFHAALGKDSWLEVLPQATHLSFAQTSLAYTAICGKGRTTAKDGVPITVATVIAWMEQAIRGKPVPAEFTAWVDKIVQEGIMAFTVKA